MLIYYAGHGIAAATPADASIDTPGYFLPQDARLGDPASYLSMRRVEEEIDGLPCHHLLLVVDCCFAGAFRWAATRAVGAPPGRLCRERFERFQAVEALRGLLEHQGGPLDRDPRLDAWVAMREGADDPFNAAEARLLDESLRRRSDDAERERRRVAELEAALTRARDQVRLNAAREAAADPTLQVVLLREVERPSHVAGWLNQAVEALSRPVACAVFPTGSGRLAAVSDGARRVLTGAPGALRVWPLDGDDPVVLREPSGRALAAPR